MKKFTLFFMLVSLMGMLEGSNFSWLPSCLQKQSIQNSKKEDLFKDLVKEVLEEQFKKSMTVLELDLDTTSFLDFKRKYHKDSLRYHPDKQVDKPEAERLALAEWFKIIGIAYTNIQNMLSPGTLNEHVVKDRLISADDFCVDLVALFNQKFNEQLLSVSGLDDESFKAIQKLLGQHYLSSNKILSEKLAKINMLETVKNELKEAIDQSHDVECAVLEMNSNNLKELARADRFIKN